MKQSLFIFIVFFSLNNYSQSQDSLLVSLEKDIEIAKNDSLKVKAMLQLGEYHLDKNFSKARYLINDALTVLKKEDNKNNLNSLANAYSLKGIIERREGNLVQSLDYYFKSKTIYEQLRDSVNISSLLHNMGMVHRYNKDPKKSIPLYQQSIAIKNRLGNQTYEIACGYNMMGVSYKEIKKRDSALWYYNKAIDLFNSINKKEDVYRAKNNIANLYRIDKKYEKALAVYFESNSYYKRIGSTLSVANAFYNISSVYKDMKQYTTAMKYADSSLAIAKTEGLKERISKAYLRKSFLYSKLDNYKEAYNHYRMFNRASDSIFNIENIKKIQALELNHKFQQEQLADSLRFDQEKREVELVAENQKSKKNAYLLLFLITLFGGAVILFLIWKNNKNRNRLAEETLEKETLQKELLDQKLKANESETKSIIADNTMRLAFKQELLDRLKEEVISEEDSVKLKQSLQSLTSELQTQIATESKFSTIQNKIEEVNKGFEAKLIKLYPSLTKTERELCALMRLNLSVKEIANVRNSSIDAVKTARYRIRKKLELKAGDELEYFIQSL